MSDMQRVSHLYFKKIHVGDFYANQDSSELDFKYSDEWINSKESFPLSPLLPLNEDLRSGKVTRFFNNMLPEGDNLVDLAKTLGVSKLESFSILNGMGLDLTSAFSLIDNKSRLNEASRDVKISFEELHDRNINRSTQPFSKWNGKIRVSAAGVQDKIGVKLIDDTLYLPEGYGNHTSHILKATSSHKVLESLIVNESFCMEISKEIGLPTADVKIIETPSPLLLIKRFDRLKDNRGFYGKKHVIDGCQLLDLPPLFKYEKPYGGSNPDRSGASIVKLSNAISKFSKKPIIEKNLFMKWIIFQMAIGNTDAHAKNISFFVDQNGKVSITPFYDQVSILSIATSDFDTELSMAIDDEFNILNYSSYDLANMCYDCNFSPTIFANECEKICLNISNVISDHEFKTPDLFNVKEILFSTINNCSDHLLSVIGKKGKNLKESFSFVEEERNEMNDNDISLGL